ncbi:MAG TPA: hypothetical protein VGO07_06915 [Candidatus Saccharimonadales bacterium]|nr:hypothetical protein [Candidatus Saccharimonadales bacterium]
MPETTLPSPEAGHGSVAAPSMAQPHVPAVPTQPLAAVPVPTTAPPVAAPATDDNTDALDEEWINKAKAIVEQTKHDPHLESQELGRVKADYLRIRYNRHIKVVEDNNR